MTAAFSLALAVLMALVCSALIWYARFSEERNAEAVLRMGASKVMQELDDEIALHNSARFLRQEADELHKDGLLVASDPEANSNQPAGMPPAKAFGMPADAVRAIRLTVGHTAMLIGLPWRQAEDRLRAQAAALVGLALFSVAAGTLGVWFLVGRTLSPIAELSGEAENAQVEGLLVHLNAPSSDAEIVQLVATLNRLLNRLTQAAAVQARFYSAASHELRTPLHTLSGHLEVGLSRERTNAEYRATMEEAYQQTTRLTSLVSDLLLLTRLNTASKGRRTERVDLPRVCDSVLAELQDGIEARQLSVSAHYSANAKIETTPAHAEMLVRNLIENAVRHSISGSGISIYITETGASGTCLEIINSCGPIEVADVRQLVEPFFRLDASRHGENGGTGLGLAICDSIARANHWGLELAEECGQFKVTVRFPDCVRAVAEVAEENFAD